MFRKTGKVLLLLTALTWAGAVACAETLEQIIGIVEKKGASIKDMSCTMKMKMDIMGQSMSMEGEQKMLLPDKIFFDMTMTRRRADKTMEAKTKLVSDGEVMYQEVNAGGEVKVNKINLAAAGVSAATMPGMGAGMGGMPANPARAIEDLKEMMDVKVLPDGKLADGQMAWVIEGKFKPEYYRAMQGSMQGPSVEVMKSQMAGMRMYVGQKDQFINRVEFLSAEGKETGSMSFEDIRFNQGLKDDLFKYRPPEGAVVTDQTEMARRQAEAMKEKVGETETPAEPPAAAEAGAPPSTVLKAGVPAPAFIVKTLDGEKLDLAALRGKRVLVLFWATWCKESVGMLAETNELAKAYKDQPFEVVTLSLDDEAEADAVKKLVADKGVTAKTAIGNNEIFDAYWVSKVPTYVLVDAEGKVVSSESEPKDLSALKKTLEKELKPQSATAAE